MLLRFLIFFIFGYFALVLSFAILFDVYMNLSSIDALYFSIVTITTLGYGDIFPNTGSMKLVVSLESFIGVAYFAVALGYAFNRYAQETDRKARKAALEERRSFATRVMNRFFPILMNQIVLVTHLNYLLFTRIDNSGNIETSTSVDCMRSILRPTLLINVAQGEPRFEVFNREDEKLKEDLQFLISTIDARFFPNIEAASLNLLHWQKQPKGLPLLRWLYSVYEKEKGKGEKNTIDTLFDNYKSEPEKYELGGMSNLFHGVLLLNNYAIKHRELLGALVDACQEDLNKSIGCGWVEFYETEIRSGIKEARDKFFENLFKTYS